MAKKILVTDNSPIYLEVLRDALSDAGYAVTTAADGLEALDRLQSDSPDLVITDLVMPWIDGERLCRYIKGGPAFSRTPVILISGLGSELTGSRGSFGPDVVIAKGPLAEFVPVVMQLVRDLLEPSGIDRSEVVVSLTGGVRPREIVRDLLAERRHLEGVLDAMGACLAELNADGRIGYVNPAGLELLGVTERRVLGRKVWEVFEAEAADRVRSAVTTALTHPALPVVPVVVEQGRRLLEISLGRPTGEEGKGGLILAFKDVTAAARREREIRALYAVAAAANDSLDLDAVLNRALDATLSAFNVRWGLIRLLDREAGALVLRTYRGFSAGYATINARIPVGEKVAGLVAAAGRPLMIPDVQAHPEYAHLHAEPGPIAGLAVVPLKARGCLLGSLSIATNSGRPFDPEDLDLLLAIGQQVGTTVENARLFGERQQAYEELQAALGQAIVSERLKALGEMAAGVAHDFNNLLAAILGRVELMLLGSLPEQIRQGLRVIQQATLDGPEPSGACRTSARTGRQLSRSHRRSQRSSGASSLFSSPAYGMRPVARGVLSMSARTSGTGWCLAIPPSRETPS